MAFFPKNIFHVSNTYNFEGKFLGYWIEIFGHWKIVFSSIASYFYYFLLLVSYLWKSVLANTYNDTDKTFPLSANGRYWYIGRYSYCASMLWNFRLWIKSLGFYLILMTLWWITMYGNQLYTTEILYGLTQVKCWLNL